MNELEVIDEKEDDDVSNALQSELWLQLWAYARRYPRDLAWLATFALVTGAMEICYPLITGSVIDAVAADAQSSALWYYALLYALTTIVISVSIGGFIRVGSKLRTRISCEIRRDGFDCDRLSHILVWGFLDVVWGSTMMIGIIIAMFWLHPQLATVVLCVMPLLAVASVYFQRRLLSSARAATAVNSRI